MAIRISGNVVIPDAVGNATAGSTALGIDSLDALTTGEKNVAVGYQAGSAITTGSNNTIIGSIAGSASLSDTVLIGAGTTERIKVDGTGLYINGSVFTGGGGGTGPKITQVQITDSSYNVLDDTAIDTAGGYIKITGTDFVTGASVIVGSTPATSVSYVSATTLNCQIPALTAGTYIVYVVNPDGSTAIRVNGLTASGTPQWVTGSTLPDQPIDAAISIQFIAAPVVSYVLQSGSSLPPGLSLTSGGLLSGTVAGLTSDTLYSFTIVAIDAEAQDSPRAFTITLIVSDPYFIYNSLLLRSELSTNSFVIDSSTNKFNISTSTTDVKGSKFNPYLTGWSNYFDGTSDSLTIASNAGFAFGTGDFTMEFYVNMQNPGASLIFVMGTGQSGTNGNICYIDGTSISVSIQNGGGTTITSSIDSTFFGIWHHIAWTREGSSLKLFVDGILKTSGTNSANIGQYQLCLGGANWGTTSINGHISNARVIKGTALYTTNFTPPTSALTAIANTSLLTCQSNRFVDNSGNNLTITSSGNVAVSSYNLFNLYNTGTGGSTYFDGTGDYLSVPSNTAFSFGTGDFTVEGWFYLTSNTGVYRNIFTIPTTTGNLVVRFGDNTSYSSLFQVSVITTSASNVYSVNKSAATLLNQWIHFAFTRSGTTCRVFLNGVQENTGTGINPASFPLASFTDSTNISNNATVSIGDQAGANIPWIGYLNDIRILKGTALYTSNFTPPTSPLTAITNTQLLTCQYSTGTNNNTFLDSSFHNQLITKIGNVVPDTFTPFYNNYSVYFDGSGDYLTIPSNAALAFGTGDFTIEFWQFTTGTLSLGAAIYEGRGSSSATSAIYISNDGQIYIGSSVLLSADTSITTNRWIHFAITRQGTTLRRFTNGVITGTATVSTNLVAPSSQLRLGTNDVLTGTFAGYLSNLRVVNGTAVYTSNFTPPTSPLTAITNTSLLTCQSNRFIDNSTNNFTITRNGDAKVVKYSPYTLSNFYSPTNFGSSMYFNSTSNALTVPNTQIMYFGLGDFTVDVWIYTTSAHNGFILASHEGGISSGFYFYLTTTTFNLGGYLATIGDFNVTAQPVYGAWNHVAWVRKSGTLRFILNGIELSTVNASTWNYTSYPYNLSIGADQNGDETRFVGWMSNLRVLKGTALYSSVTVPTTALTAVTGTQLLTCQSNSFTDNSSNNFTVSPNGNVTIGTSVIPFANTYSVYFDGNGDYLSVADNAVFYSAAQNLTLEAWIYPTSSASTQFIISQWGSTSDSDTQSAYNIIISSGKFAGGFAYNASTSQFQLVGTTTITLNQWYHVALVREGSKSSLYVNGQLEALNFTLGSLNVNNSPQNLLVGLRSGLTSPFTGYVSNLRYVVGTAIYSTNFTPPTTPVITPTTETSLLLTGGSAGIYDATGNNAVETFANAKLSNTVTKYLSSSMYFDGTGDYLSLPSNPTLAFGTGNYTVEAWIYLTGIQTNANPTIYGASSTGGFVFGLRGTTPTSLAINAYGSADTLTANFNFSFNIWYYVTASRSGTTTRIFVNGTLINSGTDSNNYSQTQMNVGAINGSQYILGYIEDLRVTTGYARYTSNFTPPTTYSRLR